MIKVEELMRGSIIEYREERQLNKGYGKWFVDIVWGFSTDDDSRDVVEIGVNGSKGFIDISCISGVELNEDVLLDYGFINVHNSSDSISYYREDIGYVKLSTYGIEHVFMLGKSIKFLHNFQRVFFDYKGYKLQPRVTAFPKANPKYSFEIVKPITAEEMIKNIEAMKQRQAPSEAIPKLKFKPKL